jgi:YfiH family protein
MVTRDGSVRSAVPVEPLWLRQVHGVAVADLDAGVDAAGAVPVEADAAITTVRGRVCVVRTADCLPVLLAASDGSVVGAAHAGWRGLAAGVIENTLAALRGRLRQDVPVMAWLGPAISAAHFEVGEEVRAAFMAHGAEAAAAFLPNDRGRWQCDLYQLARQRLREQGVTDITGGEHCTYAQADRFFSHRRDVQHGKLASTGRMATLIWREL